MYPEDQTLYKIFREKYPDASSINIKRESMWTGSLAGGWIEFDPKVWIVLKNGEVKIEEIANIKD